VLRVLGLGKRRAHLIEDRLRIVGLEAHRVRQGGKCRRAARLLVDEAAERRTLVRVSSLVHGRGGGGDQRRGDGRERRRVHILQGGADGVAGLGLGGRLLNEPEQR